MSDLKSLFHLKPSEAETKSFHENASKLASEDHVKFLHEAVRFIDKDKIHETGTSLADRFHEHKVTERQSPPWHLVPEVGEEDLQFEQRTSWQNSGGNQLIYPLKLYKPKSLDHLIYIVQQAEAKGCRVKAVGSKHAWSDVAMSTDFMVDTHGLNAVLPIENEMNMIHQDILAEYLNKEDKETIFQVEGGIRIRELNEELFKRGLALINMGGFDEQTIVGAASTSTHGTGVKLEPVSDAILSLTLVSTCGDVYRIEPSKGITIRHEFVKKYPHIKLIKDDEIFHSVAVSMGSMGIIYSIILKVRASYHLKEPGCYRLENGGN
jgi:FAD/FMN-containing dehydrogenase